MEKHLNSYGVAIPFVTAAARYFAADFQEIADYIVAHVFQMFSQIDTGVVDRRVYKVSDILLFLIMSQAYRILTS